MSNTPINQRILKETQKLATDPIVGISAEPDKDNPRYFYVTITGPKDSPYEGGLFKLQLYLPDEYPLVPPKVLFMTKIYHPNIDFLGRVGLPILKTEWSPAFKIRSVLVCIQRLLFEPYTGVRLYKWADEWGQDDKIEGVPLCILYSGEPLNEKVNEHWLRDKNDAIETASLWTLKYASQ